MYTRSVAAPTASLQQQALARAARRLHGQAAERPARALIEQQRILVRPLRKQPLGEAGHEHDAERAATRLMRAADEDAAVSAIGRLDREQPQALSQHVAHLTERDGTHVGERSQL